jgi:hypothetical protein
VGSKFFFGSAVLPLPFFHGISDLSSAPKRFLPINNISITTASVSQASHPGDLMALNCSGTLYFADPETSTIISAYRQLTLRLATDLNLNNIDTSWVTVWMVHVREERCCSLPLVFIPGLDVLSPSFSTAVRHSYRVILLLMILCPPSEAIGISGCLLETEEHPHHMVRVPTACASTRPQCFCYIPLSMTEDPRLFCSADDRFPSA